MIQRQACSIAIAAIFATLGATIGCDAPSTEERAREAAADIQASITDYDGPALNQEVDKKVVLEVQTQLTTLNEYMGEINGESDQVLVNSIQAFQRAQNEQRPWWLFWQHHPNDGLITDELRQQLASAAAAS